MAKEKGPKPTPDEARRKRVAKQLRDNLARRKAQARARRAGEADQREGMDAVGPAEDKSR